MIVRSSPEVRFFFQLTKENCTNWKDNYDDMILYLNCVARDLECKSSTDPEDCPTVVDFMIEIGFSDDKSARADSELEYYKNELHIPCETEWCDADGISLWYYEEYHFVGTICFGLTESYDENGEIYYNLVFA